MANFDIDGYFAKRHGNPGTDKLISLAQASQDKVNKLHAFRESKAAIIEPDKAAKDSWVDSRGLNPNGTAGSLVNIGASVASSIPTFVGTTGALITDAMSYVDESQLTDVDSAAFAKYRNGTATAEDMAILNQRKAPRESAPTTLQLFERALESRKSSADLRAATNFSKIIHHGKREQLVKDLGENFQNSWEQAKDGGNAILEGNVFSGAADAIAGLSKLAFDGGKALITNKGATAEYAAENLVNLAPGFFGLAGKTVMGAHNLAVGSEHYQKGVTRYQDVHDGALPPVEQRKEMGGYALKEAIAEQAGDLFQLGAAKLAGKSIADATRTGFKESLKNIVGAGVKGGVAEFPVEAYQTYAEGRASLTPVSDKDIYVGGSIGLASGGLITGGVRTLAEVAGATPEKQAVREAQKAKDEQFIEAAKTNDTTAYLDKTSKDYDPIQAVRATYVNAISADSAPEAKTQNVDKTNEIIKGLEEHKAVLQDAINLQTPEGIKKSIADIESSLVGAHPQVAELKQLQLDGLKEELANFKGSDPKTVDKLTAELATLDKQLSESIKLRDQLVVDTKPKPEDIVAAVDKADAEVDTTTEEGKVASQAAAKHVVSLAMMHPGEFSSEYLTRLTENAKNSLSESQKAYLRTISASRLAENASKNGAIVNKEIVYGDPAKRQLGIADYTSRMAQAVSSNDVNKANTAISMLAKFTEGHQQKYDFFLEQYKKAGKTGAVLVIPTKNGWEVASNQSLSMEELRALGGNRIAANSVKMIRSIGLEVSALTAAETQLQSAYNLKFNPSAAVSTKIPPVSSTTIPVTQLTTTPNQSTGVNSIVDPVVASTPVVPTQKEQGTAPVVASVKPDPSKDYVGTDKEGNQTDLAQGGKPYTSFTAVRKAKRKNPLLRIIKHEGGYVLAPKTEKQIAAQAKAAERLTKPITAKPGYPMALHEFIAYLGGLKREDAITELGQEKNIRIGNRWLYAAKGNAKARTFDEVRVNLIEAGYDIAEDATEANVIDAIKASIADPTAWFSADGHNQYNDLLEQQEAEQAALTASELDQYYALSADADLLFESNEAFKAAFEAITSNHEATLDEMVDSIEALIAKFKTDANNETSTEQTTQSTQATEEAGEVSSEGVVPETVTEEVGDTGGEGRLSVFQEVIDFAGKKFNQVYKNINLVAYNLKQKLGKDNKTQRPLIAVNNFLTNWPDDVELAKFVGVEELNEVQKDLLQHFKETADSWLPKITANLIASKVDQGVDYKIAIRKINAAVKAGTITQTQANKELAEAKAKSERNTKEQLEEFKFQDPIKYFLLTNEGKPDIEENIKTAIAVAAYSHIAENAKSPQVKDMDSVKSIFGLSDYDYMGEGLYTAVADKGVPSKVAINSMGQRVSQALGLSNTDVATQDFLPRLESDFGAHVLKLLTDTGVMEQNVVKAEVITRGLAAYRKENPSDTKQGDMFFIRMVRNPADNIKDRKLNPLAELISGKAKNTSGVLGKLFGVEAQITEPSWEPIPFTQKTTDNTEQGVPPALAKIVAHENATPFKVNVKVWDLMQVMDQEEFLKMAGLIDVDPEIMHKSNVLAAEAKNDALRREYEAAMDYISRLEMGEQAGGSPHKLDQPIYINHSVWKQQRVGVDGVINPQGSKLHRWLLTRDAWATEVASDGDLIDSFHLRVAEGLGVKTDKQANEKSLGVVKELFNTKSVDPKTKEKAQILQDAIDAINTTGDTSAIIAGVKAGGEKMHSLDALMAMAAYQKAKKAANGKSFTFNVSMMGEVDGVTNGPMLSHLVLGAGSPTGNSPLARMMSRLNKGGFFREGDGTNYNVWRGEPNRSDLYESTIAAVIRKVKESGDISNFDMLQKITGQLHDETKGVLKDGRNIIKTPLTAMLFGSTVSGAIDSMFGGFMEKTYEGFEAIAKMDSETDAEAAAQQAALVAYIKNLNDLLRQADAPLLPLNKHGDFFLTTFEFSQEQEAALEAVFKDTLGVAVETVMKEEFADFLAIRDTINDAANATFGIYDAAYQGIRQDVLAELMESGDIDFSTKKDGTKVPLHDLTKKQKGLIDKRIKALNPTVHTYMSKQGSTSAKSGLHISKSSRKLSQEPMYQSEAHFGTGFSGTGAMSMSTAAYQRILATPGVGMLPMMIHSLDSAISHLALMDRAVLNVHDAHGTGLGGFIETAQRLNQMTWKVLLNYSPAAEMRDSFTNTLLGMDKLLAEGKADSVIPFMRKELERLAKDQTFTYWEKGVKQKFVPSLQSVLSTVAVDMYHTAYNSDTTKLETMASLKYVDQYALEGGQYEVTEADKAEVAKLQKALKDSAVPPEVKEAIQRINAAVLNTATAKPEAKATAAKQDITTTLKERGEVPAKEILRDLLAKLRSEPKSTTNSFQRTLLLQLGTLVSDKLNIVWKAPVSNIGAIAEFDRNNTIYINPDISAGVLTEAILHETTHAVVHLVLETGDAAIKKELNDLLELVLVKLRETNHPDLAIFESATGLQELVAYGITNENFRTDVLQKITMKSKNQKNRFITAFEGFISAITKALFGENNVKKQELLDTGMGVLITNFSGLLAQVTESKGEAQPNSGQSLAMAATKDIDTLTTESLYNALDEGKVNPTFDEHLRSLLTSIVGKLHGPYGTFKSQIERNLVRTPKGLWDQAKKDGIVPFASASLAANIQMNDQVAFVLEQVEVTVASALSDNKGEAHTISTELDKLYQEAHKKLTVAGSPLSQELQDFLFKMDGGLGGKSDHLARFAALGLAHPEVNKALQFGTSKVEGKANPSFAGRLETLFHKVLEWFNNKMVHTHAGQQADEKLAVLVNQLVNIEAKRKEPMKERSSAVTYIEGMFKTGTDKAKSSILGASQSNLIKNSKNSFVKGAGAVVSTIAGERTDQVMATIQQIRDKHFTDGQGIVMTTINEIRGSHDGNKIFHQLIREAKLREGQREDLIVHTGNVAIESFANKGKDLTLQEREAISVVMLRTDLSSLLDGFTLDQVQKILSDPKELDAAIAAKEYGLTGMRHQGFYSRQSKLLGYKLANGVPKGKHLLMNANNIAQLAGTKYKADQKQAIAAEPVIDQLATLYAIKYTNPLQVVEASKVMAAEATRGNESGVEMVLKLHKALQKQSKEELFKGSESLMMKGYTPEIYDPKKEVLIAAEQEGKELVAQGYSRGKRVAYDPKDPDKIERRLYTRDGGGLRPWLSGSMSFTGEASKGSRSATDNVQDLIEWKINKAALRKMQTDKLRDIGSEFVHDPSFDPRKVQETFAAPILNPDGGIVEYRYLMSEDNKDSLLNRDSRFDKVLGTFAGSIYDKTSTKENNRKIVQALHDQYKKDFITQSVSYRKIGPKSTDPELLGIYRMLPEDTKQAIQEVWGTDYMMVRSDLMDITFGYRKQSVTDAFNKEKKNVIEKMFVDLATTAMGKKAAYNIRRVEDVWQELVGETKDILVVKNVSTLLGNIGSNISLLYWQGVPFKDMIKYHRIALKGMTDYRKDSAALIELETKLNSKVYSGGKANMEREVIRLKAAIDANPVKEIIDAGLMPSIVEDISPDNDIYSYKSRLTGYVDDKTDGVNKHIKGAARMVYMAKDTKMYQALRHATQLSDFVARYSLYQHVTTRKDNPMAKAEAVQLASDAFINYDLPSHRNLQYLNDMGFVMFTKYYIRIQKTIARLYADSPGRALAMLIFESYVMNAPVLTDSGFFHKIGNNPFTVGAFNYPSTLDELGTIKALAYPFK